MEPTKKSSAIFSYGTGDQDRMIRQAMFNTGANVFVLLAGCGVIALYWVLETFFRPLMWAMLCGAFLHPFKYQLTKNVKSWLHGLESTGTPISIGVLVVPLNVLNVTAENMVTTVSKRWKVILLVSMMFCSIYVTYHHTLLDVREMSVVLWRMVSAVTSFLSSFTWKRVLTIDIGYALLVIKFWSADTNFILSLLAIPVWFITLYSVILGAGAFSLPLAVIIIGTTVVGLVSGQQPADERQSSTIDEQDAGGLHDMSLMQHINNFSNLIMTSFNDTSISEENSEHSSTMMDVSQELSGDGEASAHPQPDNVQEVGSQAGEGFPNNDTSSAHKDKVYDVVDKSEGNDTYTVQEEKKQQDKSSPLSDKTDVPSNEQRRNSDKCFIFLFWSIVLVILWTNMWILALSPILLLVLIGKRFGRTLVDMILEYLSSIKPRLQPHIVWFRERFEVVCPHPIRKMMRIVMSGDRKIVKIVLQSADTFISIVLILLLFIGVVLLSIFMCFKLQSEGIHLVTLASNLVQNSSTHTWINDYFVVQANQTHQTSFHSNLDPMIANVYNLGRDWIKTQLQERITHTASREVIQDELLDIWDSLYQNWITKNTTHLARPNYDGTISTHITQIRAEGVNYVWKKFRCNLSDILSFISENIGILKSVLESLWILVRGNVNLAVTILISLLQIILGGSTALFNLVISTIVFLTTLFYLLSTSSDTYKPVEWISGLTVARSGGKFAKAVEDGIGGVFAASLKMATFYGLYTWVTHSVFGINIVFLPSVFAAVLGAIPFVGTYWAAIPAVLELSLIHGEVLLGVLLVIFHVVPTFVVDTAIYSDIKGGGHPYLTGLAIAGGIYCFGLQGAIIGPILLCCIIVAMNLYSALINPEHTLTPTTPGSTLRRKRNSHMNRSISLLSL